MKEFKLNPLCYNESRIILNSSWVDPISKYPSFVTLIESTAPILKLIVLIMLPVSTFHIFIVLSIDPLIKYPLISFKEKALYVWPSKLIYKTCYINH